MAKAEERRPRRPAGHGPAGAAPPDGSPWAGTGHDPGARGGLGPPVLKAAGGKGSVWKGGEGNNAPRRLGEVSRQQVRHLRRAERGGTGPWAAQRRAGGARQGGGFSFVSGCSLQTELGTEQTQPPDGGGTGPAARPGALAGHRPGPCGGAAP